MQLSNLEKRGRAEHWRVSSPIPFADGIGDGVLGWALPSTALGAPTGDRMAYSIMVGAGRRVLLIEAFHARPNPMELDPATAEAASRELIRRLARWTRVARALHSRLPELSFEKRDRIGATALAARMEAWAVYLAIDRCYSARMRVNDTAICPLSVVLSEVFDALDAFDATLQRCDCSPFFAATSSAAAHWRKLLAYPWREMPPWWLDENTDDPGGRP